MKAHDPHASTNASPRPLVVGLTGGMAAGKSTVVRMLETLGAAVWDADSVAKDLYKTHPQLRDAILERWGERSPFATAKAKQWTFVGLPWPK